MFKTVTAGGFASSGEPSDISRAPWHSLSQEKDGARMVARIAEIVNGIAPMRIAIFILGASKRTLSSSGFPAERLQQLQARFESCPNLIQEMSRNATPRTRWFADGSTFYLLPLADGGILEAILCLHGIRDEGVSLSDEQLRSLLPLCRAAASAVARIVEGGAAQENSSP